MIYFFFFPGGAIAFLFPGWNRRFQHKPYQIYKRCTLFGLYYFVNLKNKNKICRDRAGIINKVPVTEPKPIAIEQPGIFRMMYNDLNCCFFLKKFFLNCIFLSKAACSICLLCVFTGVDYLLWAVFDLIILKMG